MLSRIPKETVGHYQTRDFMECKSGHTPVIELHVFKGKLNRLLCYLIILLQNYFVVLFLNLFFSFCCSSSSKSSNPPHCCCFLISTIQMIIYFNRLEPIYTSQFMHSPKRKVLFSYPNNSFKYFL